MVGFLEDINKLTVGQQAAYNLQDSVVATGTAYRMDALHILELKDSSNIANYGRYAGVYHYWPNSSTCEIHLSTSQDLVHWHFKRVLLTGCDMPYIKRLDNWNTVWSNAKDSWIVMAHEQWTGSQWGVGVKLYYSENDLLNGTISNNSPTQVKYNLGSTTFGTPNIYTANIYLRNSAYVLDMQLGYHYNDNNGSGIDRQGLIAISNYPLGSATWTYSAATAYDNQLYWQGANGNRGQREFFTYNNHRYVIQEGNIQGVSPIIPTDFGAWRLWLYSYKDNESSVYPAPGSSRITATTPDNYYFTPIFPRTHGRSYSFGNPSCTMVTSPSGTGKILVCSYMLFAEGAASGEAGPLLFYVSLPDYVDTVSYPGNSPINAMVNPSQMGSLPTDVAANDFSVFPNPVTNNVLNIHFKKLNGTEMIRLYDMSGKMLLEKRVTDVNNAINTSEFSKGVYIINVGGVAKKVSF